MIKQMLVNERLVVQTTTDPLLLELVNAYDAHGYNRKVRRITKRQLRDPRTRWRT